MKTAHYARLVGKEVIPCETLEGIAEEFQNPNRYLLKTKVSENVEVSTVFLVLNHGWVPGKDRWFETMVFGGTLDGEQERYETYEQAEGGHWRWVELAKGVT